MNESLFPRVLLVSHNVFSSSNNMGKTLSSLFTDWDKQKIAQLYFRPEISDNDICDDFFRITDKDVLRSIISKDTTCGKIIDSKFSEASKIDTKIKSTSSQSFEKLAFNLGGRRLAFASLLRDALWKIGKWNSVNLNQWIDKFNPELVVFVPGDYVFTYEVAFTIASKRNIPLIIYYTDDYLTKRFSFSPIYYYKINRLLKTARKVAEYSSAIFTIGELMKIEYSEKFKKPCYPFMNSIVLSEYNQSEDISNTAGDRVQLSYVGSLHTNRWKSIVEIVEGLMKLNQSHSKAFLSIYCGHEVDKSILDKINVEGSSAFCGSVDSEGVKKVISESDIVLHVEAFDSKSRNLTRLSISTKIPEYMASGKCIFAYGPEEIASIRYIKDFNFGVAANKAKLVEQLEKLINDGDLRINYGKKARSLAEKFHDAEKNRKSFAKILYDIANKDINLNEMEGLR